MADETRSPGRESYAAFISYSHSVDGKLAPAIHHALQRFAKPWYRRRTVRIFRDEASLAVNPHLWSMIEQALASSEFFILLAAPESAASHWVGQELECWLRRSTSDRLLLVLTDGEIAWDRTTEDFDWARTTALPKALARAFREEPLHLDLRWARTDNDLTLKHPGFHAAIAELAATVRGWDKDEIVGEDIRQHRRTVRLAWSAVAGLAGLALAASVAAALFLYQRGVARQRELEAQQRLYTANVNQALVATRGQDMDRAARILELQIPRRDTPDLRGFEWYHLWQQSHRELATFPGLALAHLAFSPDGRLLAVGGAEGSSGNARADDKGPGWVDRGELRIWDVHTGRQLVARPLDRCVSGIAFSPDARFVAAVTQAGGPAVLEGNDVVLFNAQTGEPQWTKREHLNFEAIAFHPSGKFFATAGLGVSAGFQGVVSVWDVGNGTQTVLPVGQIGWVRALAFSPNGEDLAIAWDAGPGAGKAEVSIWNLARRAVGLRLTGPWGNIMSIAYSADGTRLIAGGDEGVLAWWSLPAGTTERVTHGHRGLIHSVAVAPNSRVVASGGWDQQVLMWNASTGETIGVLPRQPNAVDSIAFAPDGQMMATASNGVIKAWNVARELGGGDTLRAHKGGLGDIAFAPDGATVATGGADGTIVLWNVASGRRTGTLELGATSAMVPTGANALAFSPDRRRLAATGEVGTKIWDLGSLQPEYSSSDPGDDLVFSADGARLLVSSEHGVRSIQVSNRESRRLVERPVEAIAISPDGNILATARGSQGPSDSSVWLWDALSGRRRCELRGHDQGAVGLAFSPDGVLLASGGYGSHVKIWDVSRCSVRATLPEEQAATGSLSFSPDGRTLAIAYGGRALADEAYISLWNTATWEELFRLPAGIAGVRTVAFSPNGKVLAAAGSNRVLNEPGTVRFWRAAGAVSQREP